MGNASYAEFVADLVQSTRRREDALPLVDETCRSRLRLHPTKPARVIVFFHGFTAAPDQFDPMGEILYRLGYNVVSPLMPGHGQAGNWSADQPPPLPESPMLYKKFALDWLDRSQVLGDQMIVCGLSGGGTLAGWLAYARANQLDRAMLYAPYLGASMKVIDLIMGVSKRANPFYVSWPKVENQAPANNTARYSYPGFRLGALQAFLDLGREVLELAQRQAGAPLFIVSSESDKAVSNTDHKILFERAVKRNPRSWYIRFDRVLDIPHAMMRQVDGNQWENLLIGLTRAYLESDFTWKELGDLAVAMTKGKTVNQALTQFGWTQRATPNLPIMLTMMDKRSLVEERNASRPQQFNRGR
ncbi:carboxylesterase [Leptolyngbya sp. FACHB-261]|uniref:alpha/beta hydrolase n=1 Tax=Leptolyngbya sp. FACHB-261 TaxID=2692806 RepID=UPI0016861EFC|nr:alpha/beta fold hydrolase [Leptolyngbya sp. FACHB-261]MBD2102083.1 alpha/beta fold hydrolase [Leptolyngbya sp. FACHB-261]